MAGDPAAPRHVRPRRRYNPTTLIPAPHEGGQTTDVGNPGGRAGLRCIRYPFVGRRCYPNRRSNMFGWLQATRPSQRTAASANQQTPLVESLETRALFSAAPAVPPAVD